MNHTLGQVEFIRYWSAASRRVHAFISTMVFNVADAEDILQEVGVTAWEKFPEYDPSRDFVKWACGIARLKILEQYKSAGHHLVQSEELLDTIANEVQRQSKSQELRHEALRECLSKLKLKQKYLIQVHYQDGISLKSIAAELGQSVESLYKSLQRLRVQLFDCTTRRLRSGGTQ